MLATDCPYCAVRIPEGAEICAICKHPVPGTVRRNETRAARARKRAPRIRVPSEEAPGWDILAGGAALFLAMVSVTVLLALI